MDKNLLNYTIRLGDNCLVLGQRMSMWCSNGPTLEEDIALANISLDLFGQATAFYSFAEEIDNKNTADDIAFKRDANRFSNYLIVELDNTNFGFTIVRNFLFDCYQFLFYERLKKSDCKNLSDIAYKSIKEVKYHLRHSTNWLIRLGDGTDQSNRKVQNALNEIWKFTEELFDLDDLDQIMIRNGIGVDQSEFKSEWKNLVDKALVEAKLKIPLNTKMISGGKKGKHTSSFTELISEMQYIPRKYPDAKW